MNSVWYENRTLKVAVSHEKGHLRLHVLRTTIEILYPRVTFDRNKNVYGIWAEVSAAFRAGDKEWAWTWAGFIEVIIGIGISYEYIENPLVERKYVDKKFITEYLPREDK